MIIWLTGKKGSGKTTLAEPFVLKNWIMLDENDIKGITPGSYDESKHSVRIYDLLIAKLALTLSKQKNIIVCAISPFKSIRVEINEVCRPIWVYLKRKSPGEYSYEVSNNYFTIEIDKHSVNDNFRILKQYIGDRL